MEHMWPTFSTCFEHLMHQWGKCLHHFGNCGVFLWTCHIYLNARLGLFLKFGTQVCEVILNLYTKCLTGLRQIGLF
jgi:hypothetical protein